MPTGSPQYTVGPIVAVVVVCLLAGLLRWIFGSGRSRSGAARAAAARAAAARTAAAQAAARATPTRSAGAGDHGLLRPVAVLAGRLEGDALRTVLTAAGIRSTLGLRPDGKVEILVFPTDVERASRLVPPT